MCVCDGCGCVVSEMCGVCSVCVCSVCVCVCSVYVVCVCVCVCSGGDIP